jgi:putative transport protein
MASWLQQVMRGHPEIAFFLVLGLGHVLGKLALGKFKLGSVTGTLLGGVLVGQLGVTLSNEVQQCFFVLFLFAIGFRTGPQFFHGLRSDGLAHAGLAGVVALTGLLTTFVLSRLFGFDSGTGAGLLAGALTESAAIGTALDSIAKLPVSEAQREAMESNIPVAFAVTYLVGMTVSTWFLPRVGPALMGVDLAAECRKLDETMRPPAAAEVPVRREFELRAFILEPGSRWVDRRLDQLELTAGADRLFVERARVQGLAFDHDPSLTLQVGDVVAVSGPRAALVDALEHRRSGLREVDDRELLGVPGDVVDVIVTQPAIDGRTLAELAQDQTLNGVFLRAIHRAGQPLSLLPATEVQRGDALTLVGWAPNVARAAKRLGVTDRATDATDMLVVATAIVAGALIGLPSLRLGQLEIGLSLPVGVLFGGLVCGWLRSVRPRWFGRIPSPTLWVFESLGLTGFVAVVGLNAGPDFVRGLHTSGPKLVLAATIAITVTLVTGVLVGRWLFRLHPGVVLGVCAGGCTATPALAAVQQAAQSPVPSLGYGIAYAVGNVLLAVWGTVIVAWLG